MPRSIAQYGDALAGQRIGKDAEGLVARRDRDFLIPVLLSATGEQEHRREWTVALGQGQRAGQRDVPVFKGHLFLTIRQQPPRSSPGPT